MERSAQCVSFPSILPLIVRERATFHCFCYRRSVMPPGMLERVVERGNAEGGGADDAIVAKIAWNLVIQQVTRHAVCLRILLCQF